MSRKIGHQAENEACHYLQQQGLTLVTQNYNGPQGEIDLIMEDKGYLVFVEVRLRHNPNYGHSLETISKSKQTRIIKTALHYLQKHKSVNHKPCRFDVIGIGEQQKMVWIKNAFEVYCSF